MENQTLRSGPYTKNRSVEFKRKRRRRSRRLAFEALENRLLLTDFVVRNTHAFDEVFQLWVDESLGRAIEQANANPGHDRILFDIPYLPGEQPTDVKTIRPNRPLPAITDPVTIDGYTQGQARRNDSRIGFNGHLTVEIDGSLLDGLGDDAIQLLANESRIEGLIFARVEWTGIEIVGHDNVIAGNIIGTNNEGLAGLSRGFGIFVRGDGNRIGGTDEFERNVISGIDGTGIVVHGESVLIQGNLIGTTVDGTGAQGNQTGIFIHGDGSGTVGGVEDGAGNVISGNGLGDGTDCLSGFRGGYGVQIAGADRLRIYGNWIGTDATGEVGIPNQNDGICIVGTGATNNVVGGLANGMGNVIRFNGGDGVAVGKSSKNNTISGNSIYQNGGLGIDLQGPDGVTENDDRDDDAEGNNLQNFPVLSAAEHGDGYLTRVKLKSHAGKFYRIEFFASRTGDESGHGEGREFIGEHVGQAKNDGVLEFDIEMPGAQGFVISATATDLATGDTSEFSYITGEPVFRLDPIGQESPNPGENYEVQVNLVLPGEQPELGKFVLDLDTPLIDFTPNDGVTVDNSNLPEGILELDLDGIELGSGLLGTVTITIPEDATPGEAIELDLEDSTSLQDANEEPIGIALVGANITVADPTELVFTITGFDGGSTMAIGRPTTLRGTVSKDAKDVGVFIDGILVGTREDVAAGIVEIPITPTGSIGQHELYVVARDNDGGIVQSMTIPIELVDLSRELVVTVKHENGDPFPDVSVFVTGFVPSILDPDGRWRTDENGQFRFSEIPPNANEIELHVTAPILPGVFMPGISVERRFNLNPTGETTVEVELAPNGLEESLFAPDESVDKEASALTTPYTGLGWTNSPGRIPDTNDGGESEGGPAAGPNILPGGLWGTYFTLATITEHWSLLKDQLGELLDPLLGNVRNIALGESIVQTEGPLGIDSLTPVATDTVPHIDFGAGTETTPGDRGILNRDGSQGNPFGGVLANANTVLGTNNFAATFTGFIEITQPGLYAFTTRSDDGNVLFIDGARVIDDNAGHGMRNVSGFVELDAGQHAIMTGYWERFGGSGFQLSYSGPDTGNLRQIVPTGVLLDDNMQAGGLTAKYYKPPTPLNTRLFAGTTGPLAIEALDLLWDEAGISPSIDFGSGTEVNAGDGTVLDRAGTFGNAYGGVQINVGVDETVAVWRGFLQVPQDATYEFTLRSDDGSILTIDEQLVVNNNYQQGMTNRSGTMLLTAGMHEITVAHVEVGGGTGIQLSWEQLDGASPFARQIIPAENLFYDDTDDGVEFLTPLARGQEATVNVRAYTSGLPTVVSAWADFNNNGTYDPAEQVIDDQPINSGDNMMSFPVPATAALGNTPMRFRLDLFAGAGPTGGGGPGEVEDFVVEVVVPVATPGDDVLMFDVTGLSGTIKLDGLAGNDQITVVGTPAASLLLQICGSEGNDLVTIQATSPDLMIEVDGGSGDDVIEIPNPSFQSIDGGSGYDVVRLLGSDHHLDLTTLATDQLQNIEELDVIGNSPNTLTLSLDAILGASSETDTLQVRYDDDDTVNYGDGWTVQPPDFVSGEYVHVLTQANATIQVANTRAWQNPLDRLDANRDGTVAPIDPLVIINTLTSKGARELLSPSAVDEIPAFYFDTNGDRFVAPLDVLLPINFLHSGVNGGSEGEPAVLTSANPVMVNAAIRGAALVPNGLIIHPRVNLRQAVTIEQAHSFKTQLAVPSVDRGQDPVIVGPPLIRRTGRRDFDFGMTSELDSLIADLATDIASLLDASIVRLSS